jgi:hypothetical protein
LAFGVPTCFGVIPMSRQLEGKSQAMRKYRVDDVKRLSRKRDDCKGRGSLNSRTRISRSVGVLARRVRVAEVGRRCLA